MIDIVKPRIATDEELLLAHDHQLYRSCKKCRHGELSTEQGETYGIGTEDTPIFHNMHEASAQIVGGTLTAVDYVMAGKVTACIKSRWWSPSWFSRASIGILCL